MTSLVQHGSDGFLFTPRNATEASQYVREIIESVDRQEEMSAAALASVRTRTWQNSSNEVRSQYQQVIREFQLKSPAQVANRRPGMSATILTKILVRLFQLLAPHKKNSVPVRETSPLGQPTSAGL